MLTLEKLESMAPGEVIDSGECINSPEDIFMTTYNLGGKMIWEARVGGNNDWAIYICWAHQGSSFLNKQGEKLHGLENRKKLVPCDEEALKRYRH